MNITNSCIVQILFMIFLRSHSYKVSYTTKLDFSTGKVAFKNFHFINLLNTKNLIVSAPAYTKKIDQIKFPKLKLTHNLTDSEFSNSKEVGNQKKKHFYEGVQTWDHHAQFYVYVRNNDILGEKKNDTIKIFCDNFTKKYLFFKNDHMVHHVYRKKVEKTLHFVHQSISLYTIWKSSAENLHMYNVYLEIIRIIEKTLSGKIFYLNIREELSKWKEVIIGTLHAIYSATRIGRSYQGGSKGSWSDDKVVRILFIGSNEFSCLCLRLIILVIKTIRTDVQVESVITKSPRKMGRHLLLKKSHVEEEACRNNINVYYYDKVKNNIYMLKNKNFDFAISISFGEIFNGSFFKIVKSNIFSLHPSLLPLYKGASPVQRSLLNNDSIFGYTIFLTNLHVDSGTTLIKKAFFFNQKYNFNDIITILFTLGTLHLMTNVFFLANYNLVKNGNELHDKLTYGDYEGVVREAGAVTEAGTNKEQGSVKYSNFSIWENGKKNLPQKEKTFLVPCTNVKLNNKKQCVSQKYVHVEPYEDNKKCYAPKIKNEEKYVCFFCYTASYIHNKVRGFINWPRAECSLFLLQNGVVKRIEVKLIKTSCSLSKADSNRKYASRNHTLNPKCEFPNFASFEGHTCFDNVPRKFAVLEGGFINIQCKNDSLLRIYKLQRKNKKIMDAQTFVNSINRGNLLY
ncbi:methionyl-tRNA formyltransferase, putative [Plasmodium ovale]|uniref:Methionyl-tRNA formyltransferase, putative n=2 Tax=Plasmodium ovale TaxID=36330 RepID=A0A1A8WYF6_PLAOA|nr:methionyl-tRNA formyltransferase, putative [Plasmodium ovale curtisi]SBS98005.1 methionyl-tRNA formyltransferase, putative [Plasmodium ovale curtisi]SCQ16774.1 methionyl-tRNA formyltransferase, putative [Plasmodium ovale]